MLWETWNIIGQSLSKVTPLESCPLLSTVILNSCDPKPQDSQFDVEIESVCRGLKLVCYNYRVAPFPCNGNPADKMTLSAQEITLLFRGIAHYQSDYVTRRILSGCWNGIRRDVWRMFVAWRGFKKFQQNPKLVWWELNSQLTITASEVWCLCKYANLSLLVSLKHSDSYKNWL